MVDSTGLLLNATVLFFTTYAFFVDVLRGCKSLNNAEKSACDL